MSRNYPLRATCPHCGLEVAASETRGLRPHKGQAVKAGLLKTPCAGQLPPPPPFVPAKHDEVVLPKHLRV